MIEFIPTFRQVVTNAIGTIIEAAVCASTVTPSPERAAPALTMDGAVVSDATASHCVNDQTSSEIELQRLRNELEAQRRSSEAVDVLAAELEEKKLEANQLRAALAREAEAHRTLRGQLASFQTVVKEASDGLGVVELVSTLQRRTETSMKTSLRL